MSGVLGTQAPAHAIPEPAHPPATSIHSTALTGLRVLIVHDWLVAWAGSERCVEQMLEVFPGADLVVGVMTPAMRDLNEVTRRARETWLGRLPGARAHHRWFLPLQGLAFATLDTSRYDLVLSSSHAFSKMVRRAPAARHLCYCHSPPRYLWDLQEHYRGDARGVQRVALAAGTRGLRALDRWSARGVDRFVANSACVAERIQRSYGRPAEVVFPPVAAKLGTPGGRRPRAEFLLSLGRLVPYKRVDLAIAAAERLGIRLVVAGSGPDRARLEQLAGRYTEFLGDVSEQEAADLMSDCRAFLFCGEEDFGIAPVEANAHGAPVIGYARGGLCETMIEGRTAEFFHDQSVPAVADAIQRAFQRPWEKGELFLNAARFAPERFRDEIAGSVLRVLQG